MAKIKLTFGSKVLATIPLLHKCKECGYIGETVKDGLCALDRAIKSGGSF